MTILVLDKANSLSEKQLAISINIYETLKKLNYNCIYHVIRSIADMEKIIEKLKFDKIFLCTGTDWGNNGTLQKVLDYYKIPYTFSNGVVSQLLYDKYTTKVWLNINGYSVPETYNDYTSKYPCMLKYVEGGNSTGVFFMETQEGLHAHVNKNYILEEYLGINEWNEFTVSLLKNNALLTVGNPVLLNKIENPVFSNNKNLEDNIILNYPEKSAVRRLIEKDFTDIFVKMEIKNSARFDFMVNKVTGKYKILEINSMPSLTPNGLYVRSLFDYNQTLSFETILRRIIES